MVKKSKDQGFVYDAFDLIKFAWDKKIILIGLSVVAFVASAILSFTITPRYQSKAIIFPTGSVAVSEKLVETTIISSGSKHIMSFGEDEEAERLLQILQSGQMAEHIINKFDLLKHYKIEPENKNKYTILYNKFNGSVKSRRTEFLSIQISVLDEDPQMAADIANSMVAYVDSIYYNIMKVRAQEAYNVVEKEYKVVEHTIAEIQDSLDFIRAQGVHDYESMAEAINRAYGEAVINGNPKAIRAIEDKLDVMAKYGGAYVELSRKLLLEVDRLSRLESKFSATKVDLTSTITNLFVVDYAMKSDAKAKPHRSLIVAVSTLTTFALALLLLLIIDNIKSYR